MSSLKPPFICTDNPKYLKLSTSPIASPLIVITRLIQSTSYPLPSNSYSIYSVLLKLILSNFPSNLLLTSSRLSPIQNYFICKHRISSPCISFVTSSITTENMEGLNTKVCNKILSFYIYRNSNNILLPRKLFQ